MSEEILNLLDLFEQPAFFVRDGLICRCNPAARSLVEEGTSLSDLLKESSQMFNLWDGSGTLNLSLELPGLPPCDAAVRSCASGFLFVAAPKKEEVPPVDANLLLSSAASLRRPLHSLLTSAGELFEQLDPEQVTGTASELNRSIYQLIRLSAQISDGVPLLLKQKKASRTPVDAAAFFDHFAGQVKPLLEASGRQFIYTSLSRPLSMDLDTALVERALFNLIANAVTYSSEGSTVSLTLHTQEHRLLVTVSDSGEGISPEVTATLFERYADRPIGDSRWGMGLGLPMVREIARLHDGAMIVCSGKEGQGTTVIFSLSTDPAPELSLHSPLLGYDYCGGLNHALVELSGCLDKENYRPDQV